MCQRWSKDYPGLTDILGLFYSQSEFLKLSINSAKLTEALALLVTEWGREGIKMYFPFDLLPAS